MRKIRVIFSDLGNIVVRYKERMENLALVASYLTGQKVTFTELWSRLADLLSPNSGEDAYYYLDTGKITAHDFYQAFLSAFSLTPSQVSEARFWPLYVAHLEPIKPVIKLWQKLQKQGYYLVVMSNGDQGSIYVADLLAARFDIQWSTQILSCQLGVKKPDSKFFQAALDSLNKNQAKKLTFANCLLIDDHQSYCDAFVTLGGQAICFNATKEPISVIKRKLAFLLNGE